MVMKKNILYFLYKTLFFKRILFLYVHSIELVYFKVINEINYDKRHQQATSNFLLVLTSVGNSVNELNCVT